MGIDLSLEQLAGLYQMGSLGKLINGLIHNLNGPLQNISMDMEMMTHSVRTAKWLPADLAESMIQRLKRMEREFDHIIPGRRGSGGMKKDLFDHEIQLVVE